LISALVQAEEAGDSLSEDEMLAMVFLLLVAGHETTVNLIACGAQNIPSRPNGCVTVRRCSRLRWRSYYAAPVQCRWQWSDTPVRIPWSRERQSPRGDLVFAVMHQPIETSGSSTIRTR
jgi:cytochrome P450 PksS